jgi:hypothetical protein
MIAPRSPDTVVRLARMGAFHQTRLSFLRQLLLRVDRERWSFERSVFDIDARGVGTAVYTVMRGDRSYSLVAFGHDLPPELRTDRVIAEAWDATFALFDGEPTRADLSRLEANVPLQEAGRCRDSELVLARANRSVRLFDTVVAALADGKQPARQAIEATGYLMRTTAVYGNGKFGIADRDRYSSRAELNAPFQAEMLTVWLIRQFTIDLVEHLAQAAGGAKAAKLSPLLKRRLGIGNATGLGMAPFLVRHPALMGAWHEARETALARVRSVPNATPAQITRIVDCLSRARTSLRHWTTDDPVEAPRIVALAAELKDLAEFIGTSAFMGPQPWDRIYRFAEARLSLEAQEFTVALLLEPHADRVDDLAARMSVDERRDFAIRGGATCRALSEALEQHYAWALSVDFTNDRAQQRFWYVSEEKLEPRLGDRSREPGAEREQPLAVARDIVALHRALQLTTPTETVAAFLLRHPEHRHTVRRVQTAMRQPYAEVRDNLIDASLRAIDLLRCKLAFFGATRFDPRSDKWLRITLFQGAPAPDEIGRADFDHWVWGEAGRA